MVITLKALSPISHGEFSDGIDLGNAQVFRRLPMIHDGRVYDVPVISGNAIRGKIRRMLAREVVEVFDLKNQLGKSFDRFYIAMANGGNLDKDMDIIIDTEKIRQIRADIPMLSLLGSALYKYMMPGMVNIGFAVPRCREIGTGDGIGLNDLTADVGLTRHLDKTVADPGDAKPMPYTVEVLIPGVELDVNVEFAPQTTPIEIACLMHGFKLVTSVGGKSGAGFGLIDKEGVADEQLYKDWLNDTGSLDKIIKFAGAL